MSRRTTLIIFIIGAALRILLVWQAPLWYDENFSYIVSQVSLPNLFAATAGDVHPPLYYLLIWPLGHIANLPPWVLRLPSILLSIGTLAIFPRILDKYWSTYTFDLRRVHTIAYVMLAILPIQLHYAQEARMYALLEFLFMVGVLAVLEDRRLLLGLSVAALLYTQNYGLFYAATLWILSLIDYAFSPRGRAQQAAIVAGCVAWLPWSLVMQGQLGSIAGKYWIFDVTPGGVLYEIWKLFWGFSLSHPQGMIASMLVTFGLLSIGVVYLFSKRPPYWYEIALLGLGPLVMSIIVSLLVQPVILFRPLIGITPFLYLLVASPLGRIDSKRNALYVSCFILPMLVMGIGGYYLFNPQQKENDGNGDFRDAIQFIETRWQAGDVILYSGDAPYVSMNPYMDLPQFIKPDCEERPYGALSVETRRALNIQTLPLDQLHGRIWYVGVQTPLLPPCEVELAKKITGDDQPLYIMQDDKLIYSAIWLLER